MQTRVLKRSVLAPLALCTFVAAAAVGWYSLQSTAAEPARTGATVGADFMATAADIKVYKTATCGCCSSWVAHLQENGLEVEAVDVDQQQLNAIKQSAGLSRDLASCHTAFIDGYVVEGHVPAQDIARLLEQRPAIAGLAVPGMPAGSPGMEMGGRFDAYHVVAFDESGNTQVFSSYNQ